MAKITEDEFVALVQRTRLNPQWLKAILMMPYKADNPNIYLNDQMDNLALILGITKIDVCESGCNLTLEEQKRVGEIIFNLTKPGSTGWFLVKMKLAQLKADYDTGYVEPKQLGD